MSQALLLRFGQEELVYLLRALELESAVGLTRDSLGNLDEDHQALALAVADRTLRARDVVHWTSATERVVDVVVSDALRICGQPLYTLIVDINGQGSPAVHASYAFDHRYSAEQSEPEPGVYQLILRSDHQDLLTRLFALGRFEGINEAYGPSYSVPRALFDSVATIAPRDPEYARQSLASGLQSDIASALVDAIAMSVSVHSFGFAQNGVMARNPRRIMLAYQGPRDTWIVEGPDEPGAKWTVTPGSNALLRDRLEALLEPALRLMTSGSSDVSPS